MFLQFLLPLQRTFSLLLLELIEELFGIIDTSLEFIKLVVKV